MTPRSPEVLAAVDLINSQPLPFHRLNWFEDTGWSGHVVRPLDATVERIVTTNQYTPEQILKIAEGIKEKSK